MERAEGEGMKSARVPWHCEASDDSDGTRRLACGIKLTVAHLHASRASFERMAKRAQCPGCAQALAAYKARLIAEADAM